MSKIARRYARALADICAESGDHGIIGKQLEDFAATYGDSDELRSALRSPVLPVEKKREILEAVVAKAMFAPTTRRFLATLLEAGRIDAVETVAAAFRRLIDLAEKRVRAEVTSAVPLESSDMTRIQASLERLTGKTVALEARVEPDVIGGAQVRIDNLVLDATVRTQLDSLGERLLS